MHIFTHTCIHIYIYIYVPANTSLSLSLSLSLAPVLGSSGSGVLSDTGKARKDLLEHSRE